MVDSFFCCLHDHNKRIADWRAAKALNSCLKRFQVRAADKSRNLHFLFVLPQCGCPIHDQVASGIPQPQKHEVIPCRVPHVSILRPGRPKPNDPPAILESLLRACCTSFSKKGPHDASIRSNISLQRIRTHAPQASWLHGSRWRSAGTKFCTQFWCNSCGDNCNSPTRCSDAFRARCALCHGPPARLQMQA
jgi:hypothetical protein